MSKKAPSLTRDQIFARLVHNQILSMTRSALIGEHNLDPCGRDLDKECGYPLAPTVYDYRRLYARGDIASRIVNAFPDECWSEFPSIYEREDNRRTAWEREWEALNKKHPCLTHLHRVDRCSGIGTFGVLLLGVDDGKDLVQPLEGVTEDGEKSEKLKKGTLKRRKLLFLRPFAEDCIQLREFETNPLSPRFGQPVIYTLKFRDPNSGTAASPVEQIRNYDVHWTRVIHVADNRESSEVWGVPRMQPVLNRLLDLRKILGGSAEMFWKGAFPGLVFAAYPEIAAEADLDEDSVKDQIEEYMNGLRRYLAATGGTFTSLAPQVADPTQHVVQQLSIIGATIGIPMRILLGTESGHLASTQDAGTWNKRVAHRQQMYVEPYIIRPFIDRLMLCGIMPWVDDYRISWRDLNTISAMDQANIALKRAQALMQYCTGGAETIVPPMEFLTMVLGYSIPEAEAIRNAASAASVLETEPVWGAAIDVATGPQGGGRKGKPPKSDPGRPRSKTPKP